MTLVVDASVALAWCFSDEISDTADRARDAVVAHGGLAPCLFWHEVRNVLMTNERRRRIDEAGSKRFLRTLRELPVETDDGHDDDTLMTLARRYDLTGYDAAYLELAVRRRCALVTPGNSLSYAAAAELVGFC